MKTGLPRHLMMTWGCVRGCGVTGWVKGETYVLALGDLLEVDFYLGLGEHVGGGGHVDEEVCEGVVSW